MTKPLLANALEGVRVGSTVAELDEGFTASVVNKSVTKMSATPENHQILTGSSRRVTSSALNRGSIAISGSYGFSGLSTMTGSLSGYLAQSDADDGRATSLRYSILVVAGIQYIDFDNLTPIALLSSVSQSVRDAATRALSAYTKMAFPDGSSDQQVTNEEKENMLQDWLEAKNRFFQVAGTGLVVGVKWGAIGNVSLDLRAKASSTDSQYGGRGSFTYAGLAASVSVEAAYSGEHKKGEDDIEKEISSSYFGNIIKEDVQSWFNNASQISLDDLFSSNKNIAELAPQPSYEPPVIPAFQVPQADPAIKSKLERLRNLEELHQLTRNASRKEAISKGLSPTAEVYEAKSNDRVDVTALEKLKKDAESNDLILPEWLFQSENRLINNTIASNETININELPEMEMLSQASSGETSNLSLETGDYTPLGIWVTKWTDLFPWLSTSVLNMISTSDIQSMTEILWIKTAIQDLEALRRIYYIAADSGLIIRDGDSNLNFLTIADSLSHAFTWLSKTKPLNLRSVQHAISNMTTDAQRIYKKWSDLRFLRNCELGLAVVYNDSYTVSFDSADFKLTSLPFYIANSLDSTFFKTIPIDFTAGNQDFSGFAKAQKFLPLILPSGRIGVFGARRPNAGSTLVLAGYIEPNNKDSIDKFITEPSILDALNRIRVLDAWRDNSPYFIFIHNTSDTLSFYESIDLAFGIMYNISIRYSSSSGWSYKSNGPNLTSSAGGLSAQVGFVEFIPDESGTYLKSDQHKMKAYPIRFKSAEGVRDWIGQSSSNNVGSFEDLNSLFQRSIEELGSSTTWTNTSENWPSDWTGETPYSVRSLRTKYLGYVPESGNIFPKESSPQ